MKKSILYLIGIYVIGALGINLVFAASSSYQKSGNYINVKEYPSYAATISSYSVVTSSAVPYGVERVFKINGTPSGSVFFTRGGSTTTIVSAGIPLSENVYYVEDTYFGNISFLTNTGTADIRISTLRKE